MFKLNKELIIRVREKRGRKNITLSSAAKEIGISAKTLGKIENEQLFEVRRTVYEKLVNWLVNEKNEV